MADSTLTAIRTKIRRLTRAPSAQQISDADINEYVNTFIQYDFPEHLRLFSLKRNFSFFTEPNIDTYETNTTDSTDPLFEFENEYITVHPPIYVDGNEAFFSQSREEFFRLYPFRSSVRTAATGDGATVAFNGTLSETPILRNEVIFTSIDANNDGLRLSDDGDGVLEGDGNGTIDYVTGAFTLNFTTGAPAANTPIESHVVIYQAARPDTILYFDNKFQVRPVPDKVYKIEMEVYQRPTELLANDSIPELQQWWQYIAYGAAKKIFEDRTDLDSVALIAPEFRRQELLVNRRTIVQQTSNRVDTIYAEQIDATFGSGHNNNGMF